MTLGQNGHLSPTTSVGLVEYQGNAIRSNWGKEGEIVSGSCVHL